MQRFYLALLAPLLRCVSNFIDKILIEKYFKGWGIGAMLIFSGLIGFVLFPIIGFIFPNVLQVPFYSKAILALSGIVYLLALIPYLKSLFKSDTSLVAPLFQMIPLFAYVLGLVFLGEVIVGMKLIGGTLIVLWSIWLSLNIGNNLKRNKEVFWYMALASFLFALYSLLFKIGAQGHSPRLASFWFYVGLSFGAILCLCYKPYRVEFLNILKLNWHKVLAINICNEVINIGAVMIANLAFTLWPLALVRAINWLQPFFILIFWVVLTRLVPHLINETITKNTIIQKLIAIIIIFIGTFLINTN